MRNKDLLTLRLFLIEFLNKNQAETPSVWRIRNRILKSIEKTIEKYNDEVDDIQCNLCVLGPNGEILIKDKQRCFTPDNQKKLKVQINELYEKEISVEITKIEWERFSASEQKWFNLTDEDTYFIMELFVNGLPNKISYE
jgi:hypothetical protein